MRRSPQLITVLCAASGMLALILDSKTALHGAVQGITLCIQSVIPSLFPFFVLSALLTGSVVGTSLSIFRPLEKLCGLPKCGESILITGLLGGYPIGARCVCQAYADGRLSKPDARRMLGFCSNAGPAFLFGMTGSLFDNRAVPFLLWEIHMVSALTVGMLLPGKSRHAVRSIPRKPVQPGQAVQQSLEAMANVCGWVILFRMVLSFGERWFLWMLPAEGKVVLTGILELTNGYIDLITLGNDRLRFVLASVFLAFGGICVILQTVSITTQAGLDLGCYLQGKLLQTLISGILAIPVSGFLFSGGSFIILALIPAAAFLVLCCLPRENKKNSSSIPQPSGV